MYMCVFAHLQARFRQSGNFVQSRAYWTVARDWVVAMTLVVATGWVLADVIKQPDELLASVCALNVNHVLLRELSLVRLSVETPSALAVLLSIGSEAQGEDDVSEADDIAPRPLLFL